MAGKLKFDVQQFLQAMDEKQEKRHEALTEKIDRNRDEQQKDHVELLHTLAGHDLRLSHVERTDRNQRWFGRVVAAGSFTFVVDLIKNHAIPYLKGH